MTLPDRVPTQRDVARLAGVSTATVSYILSGRRDRARPVLPATRERVLSAVHQLGYQVNHAGRSLRRQRTELVCVVYRAPTNPSLDRLVERLQEAAAARGYSVLGLPLTDATPPSSALRILRERQVDGAIIANDAPVPAGELRDLAPTGPALLVYDDDLTPQGFDVVRQGRAAACRAAVEHLIARGHRRIAYLAHRGELADPTHATAKYQAYRAALTAAGLPVDPDLTRTAADARHEAYTATADLLNLPAPHRPTALFSASDRGAIAAISAARDHGHPVPDALAVIGVGNLDEGRVMTPALTTVGCPDVDYRACTDRLFSRIATRDPSGGVELAEPWRLIVRASA